MECLKKFGEWKSGHPLKVIFVVIFARKKITINVLKLKKKKIDFYHQPIKFSISENLS
jgi:hypothetical protein